jgi:hypothetical protein
MESARSDLSQTTAENHELLNENQALRQFYAEWNDSIPFRVVREAKRPWLKLASWIHGRRNDALSSSDRTTTGRTAA